MRVLFAFFDPEALHHDKLFQSTSFGLRALEYIGEAYLMAKKPIEAEKHLVPLQALCEVTATGVTTI